MSDVLHTLHVDLRAATQDRSYPIVLVGVSWAMKRFGHPRFPVGALCW